MRQTSRAVALLLTLESAQAADRPITTNIPALTAGVAMSNTMFNPTAASITSASGLLNSRTAGYRSVLPNAVFTDQETGPKWTAATAHSATLGASSTDNTATTFTPGSTCIACIGGSGVWCSRTYAYMESGSTYNMSTTAIAGAMNNLSGSDTAQIGGAALDQGACCESALNFNTFIGTLKVPQATITPAITITNSTTGVGQTMVEQACPAVTGGVWATGPIFTATAAIDSANAVWSSWWCSNGLYKTVMNNTGTGVVLNSQQTIPDGVNKRTELAMVGCPQIAATCGQTTSASKLIASADAAATVYAMPLSTFTINDKCTWVVYAVDSAPTFVLQNSALTGTFGLASANWQIHSMEYTAAGAWTDSQQSLPTTTASNDGYTQMTPALSNDSYLPLFNMPANAFASLRTWYGAGATSIDPVTGMSSNWSSAGQAAINNTKALSLQLALVKSQLYGNVANVPMSGNVLNTGSSQVTATQNYGTANSVQFDLRQMRYFPAQVAQTVWTSGSNLQTQYNTALASYNTAKTTWDAYVAILEKNAKQDAFAALFSPPKAPTVPPLPNKPWQPAKYSGYVRATAAETAAYAAGSTMGKTEASPTAQQFWTSLAAAQTVGGWGSFTATIFTFRNGWGKSFGTIGYSGDADNQSMSDVWNYKWTCAANSAAGAAASTTTQCANSYTATAGSAANAGTITNANTVKMVTAVSLWTTSNSNTANDALPTKYLWATNGFQITFTASAWKSGIVGLTPLADLTAATSAKSLTGIAGAQALAATSAAALAVAAALY